MGKGRKKHTIKMKLRKRQRKKKERISKKKAAGKSARA